MIEMYLIGGLGNQLFQYAFAKSLAYTYNQDIEFIVMSNAKDVKRKVRLDKFSIMPIQYRTCDRIENFKVRIINKISNNTIRWKLGYHYEKMPFEVNNNSFNPRIHKNVYCGYWQNENNFCNIKEQLKRELIISENVCDEAKQALHKIEDTQSVCVHIRRGDYVNNNRYAECTKKYYEDAINLMTLKINNPVFFVFSNEINFAKQMFENIESVEYIDYNQSDYLDFKMMYSCKHFIIPNSTFAWWAAYLSNSYEKIVIAPEKWINSAVINPNCKNWISIKNVR